MFQPQSVKQTAVTPYTEGQIAWIDKRPYLRDNYDKVYGLFLPPDKKGKPPKDLQEYLNEIKRDERRLPSPKERLKLANNNVASWLYQQAEKKTDDKDKLAAYKEYLSQNYIGYPQPYDTTRLPTQIRDITAMVNDKRVTQDPATRKTASHVREFLRARQTVMDTQNQIKGVEAHTGISKSKKPEMVDLRDKLTRYANLLIKADPGFKPFWETVFSHELPKAA